MKFTPLSTLLAAAALAAAPALTAQSVHWDPPRGPLPVGGVSQLQLVFDGCAPDDTPVLPKVDGLRLDYRGQSTNLSLINGTFTRNVTESYAVLLSRQQEVEIPAFSIDTNKGRLRVPAARYQPASATVGSSGASLGDAAKASLTASPASVWAGEVFDLRYTIDASAEFNPSWGRGVFEWDPSPLVTEDWSQPEPFETGGGAPRTGLSYRTRAVAPAPGLIRLNPTSQLINLSVGVSGFGFFQQRQYQQFAVPDSTATLDVRPLPTAPADFTGAVGEFRISSKVVPLHVKAGDPVTWTVELSGSGNWPEIRGLPAREAPADFQVVQPKPKRTQPKGKLFEGTLAEDVVLVPTRAGTYELPALNFAYFDPKSGSYRTIAAAGAEVTVEANGAAPAAQAAGLSGAAPGAPAAAISSAATEARAPEMPAATLGDPVEPSSPAPAPLGCRALVIACAAPFALVGIFWAALALRRARETDPLRATREARARLARTLEALRTAPSPEKGPLLLAWQRDSALLWEIAHAAPPAAALADLEWTALWSESDRCLYGADPLLPPDWVARAQAALTRKTPRPFSPARLLRPQNLFPFLLLAAAALGPRLNGAGPAEAYQSGDFAAAERLWSGQLAADPLDWTARHNLSLALAQQDRWGEAAAQAAAAFVQNPASPATRRQLALACEKAGFIPEPLDTLTQSGPVESLARLESPGAWQRIGAGAAAAAAAALALLLAAAYGVLRRAWALPVALTALALAVLAGAAALLAYRAYGITADTRAVVVWRAGVLRSIPTEADVSQKTTPLAAGSSAVADRQFLGWIHLSFPNGQTGWTRRGDAVYLWRFPRE